jgi:hypothetical protein
MTARNLTDEQWFAGLDRIANPNGVTSVAGVDELRVKLVDSAGLDTIPDLEPLVGGDVLPLDSMAWLQGASGSGKTFVALDIAGCVGTGQKWHGRPVAQGHVLYIVAEGVAGIRQRVRAWEHAYSTTMTAVSFLPVAVQAALEDDWAALVGLAAELTPKLVVLDTQARVTVGMDENSARDMGVFIERVDQLRRATRACVLVQHHQGHTGGRMRGSTALYASADVEIEVAAVDELVTLRSTKPKNTAPFDDINLRMVKTLDSLTLVEAVPGERPKEVSRPARHMAMVWWQTFEDEEVSPSRLIDVVAPKTTFYRLAAELKEFHFAEKRSPKPKFQLWRLIKEPKWL